ncbi:hypothetical protein VitviT2T_025627 [Vitis vinifera]|uniref:FRIGIDA-like protein n=1 Tax=Vitis vinifera TaxID=29760 RepID=A0ABY9DJR4_VITVI|nr:FRIGIDA-like protein 2 [Vitis vinifera]WKA07852.1 hypothetical protein VitviT2T_025627 [Vitis vinifera]|eukprot:XP_010663779.1 PREDICTED: FRIGIDA-like protein 2 [Vitis vinifera]
MVSVENSSTDPNLFLTNRLGDIRAYSYSLASFTLQWRDLEELFESIQLSVDDCFNDIQLRQKQITEALSSSVPSQPRPELKYLCLNMDGKGLRSFLIEKTKARPPFSIGDEVSAALLSAPDPAMLVLDAVDGFYPRKSKSKGKDKRSELVDIRRTCVLLLEQLMKISPRIGPAVTAKAKKLAIEWKAKINGENDNSSRVLGLLLLLAAYELGCVFQLNVLFDLFEMVPLHHQASELYRRLGLMDRVSDFIQNLITKRKQIEAIKFIYEFGLVDKFPPFPLLRAHLQDAKRAHKKATKEADSRQSKDEAFDKEIAAVKAVISCVKDHKIECKYTSKNLGKRINQLKALKRSREKEIEGGKDCTRTAPQAQQQHHNKKKRLRADPAANSNPK